MLPRFRCHFRNYLLLFMVLLAACSATRPTPTEIPATETAIPTATARPTASPSASPTLKPSPIPSTPTLSGELMTSPEQLFGTWEPLSGGEAMFARFNADGTCSQAFSLEGLNGTPTVSCKYIVEGSQITFTEATVIGVPPCSASGKYEVWIVDSDSLRLKAVADSCRGRKLSTAGEYIKIP